METIIEKSPLDAVLTESGLVLTEAEEIKQSYLPFFEQMAEIKELAKKIDFENPTELDEKIARDLRIKTMKIRTGSEVVKDDRKKKHSLKANLEQSAWNLIKATCLLEEETFAQVEKARERKEIARKTALKIEREGLLKKYCEDSTHFNLGEISDEQFASLFDGFKLAHVAKLKAELEAEQERIAKEKADAEEKIRIKAENDKLKAENEAKERLLKEQKEAADLELKKVEALRLAEQENADALLESQRKAAEAKAKKEKNIADAKLKEEREAKEKLEAELKAKKDQEDQAIKDAAILAEAELNKGDSDKLTSLIVDLEMLKLKYTFSSKKYKTLQSTINELLEKIIVYTQGKV